MTARLLTREHGKILAEAYFDSGTPGGMIDAFYALARTATEARELESAGRRTEIRHEPHGVVAALLPFNWPVAVLGNKAIPALLTGNAVVAKAPPGCPGAVLMWSAAFAAGLPPGLLNVLAGPDASLGEALVTHPGVDMVSFTGGVTTGQAVMRAASGAVRPVVLELGGNDPAIIAPDVEVDDELARTDSRRDVRHERPGVHGDQAALCAASDRSAHSSRLSTPACPRPSSATGSSPR